MSHSSKHSSAYMTSSKSLLFLSMMALAVTNAAAGFRGLREINYPLASTIKKMNCKEELELKIECAGDCACPPEDSPSKELKFDIEIKTKTDKTWELEEVVMAAGSVTRPFEYCPLPTDPQEKTIAPDSPVILPWEIESDDIVGGRVILLGNAVAINDEGKECSAQAVFNKE